MSCNVKDLERNTIKEKYWVNRFKAALDKHNTSGVQDKFGGDKNKYSTYSKNFTPNSAGDTIDNDLDTTTSTPKVYDKISAQNSLNVAMIAREIDVSNCIADIITYQGLDNAKIAYYNATNTALKHAQNEKTDALNEQKNLSGHREKSKRISEVNTYYNKQYDDYINIFTIVLALCMVLILSLIHISEPTRH